MNVKWENVKWELFLMGIISNGNYVKWELCQMGNVKWEKCQMGMLNGNVKWEKYQMGKMLNGKNVKWDPFSLFIFDNSLSFHFNIFFLPC